MNCRITITDEFARSAKKLAKKYRSLKSDLVKLNESLQINPYLGDKITENFYKIRLAIKSKGKGKSGGARVITYVTVEVLKGTEEIEVLLLKIYDKSDRSNIGGNEIRQILERHFKSLQEEE